MIVIRDILNFSALILSIVNGFMLLRNYLRDRPKLVVKPIHPEIYQWWFKLPSGEFEDNPTRKYGFLAYIGISNRGLRKVFLESWRLYLKTAGYKKFELKPISIPEPIAKLGNSGSAKAYPVLGHRGLLFSGETLIESGGSISGMVYFVAEFWGGEAWNPIIKGNKIAGELVIRGVYGKKAHCKIIFSEKSLEEIKNMIEGIEKIL